MSLLLRSNVSTESSSLVRLPSILRILLWCLENIKTHKRGIRCDWQSYSKCPYRDLKNTILSKIRDLFPSAKKQKATVKSPSQAQSKQSTQSKVVSSATNYTLREYKQRLALLWQFQGHLHFSEDLRCKIYKIDGPTGVTFWRILKHLRGVGPEFENVHSSNTKVKKRSTAERQKLT